MLTRRLCALALVVTAAIHVAVIPEHQREWPTAAAFFLGLAIVEVVLAGVVFFGTDRRLLRAGAVVSAASAVLWAVSRTVGLPVGPDAFAPEAIGMPDLVATALEAASAAFFLRLAVGTGPVDVPAPAHR